MRDPNCHQNLLMEDTQLIKANDSKYIVFKRAELYDGISVEIRNEVDKLAIQDAVVIRRQDRFASPCFLTYSIMMGMVAENHGDPVASAELLAIADYFHDQGVLAGEEGWKLPTL